jgi:hypothetical protein
MRFLKWSPGWPPHRRSRRGAAHYLTQVVVKYSVRVDTAVIDRPDDNLLWNRPMTIPGARKPALLGPERPNCEPVR